MITCQNNGICTRNGNVYSCQCVGNFYGPNCQYQVLNSTTFINSTILTQELGVSLLNLIGVPLNSEATRVYQASKDGFSASNFHSKANGILGTFTVVKSKSGNVFGGFTMLSWGLSTNYYNDPNAFIFSLINQQNYPFKLNQSNTTSSKSVYISTANVVVFGGGNDLSICDQSNSVSNSNSLMSSYQLPLNYTYGTAAANSFLAGSQYFLTVEVEVYSSNAITCFN